MNVLFNVFLLKFLNSDDWVIMPPPPTLKKVEGAYCSGLVRPFKNNLSYGFLNFINGFLVKE